MGKDEKIINGTSYKQETPQAVVDALEEAREKGYKVRLFLGDSATGADWGEENDIIGTIGRSTGPNKIPLLIVHPKHHGGGGILDRCIVKIVKVHNGVTLYQHPSYSHKAYKQESAESVNVIVSGEGVHARFASAKQAAQYVQFMSGEIHRKTYLKPPSLPVLMKEFRDLTDQLFQGESFVELDEGEPDVRRYNQLLGLFRPQFRTEDWIDPRVEDCL